MASVFMETFINETDQMTLDYARILDSRAVSRTWESFLALDESCDYAGYLAAVLPFKVTRLDVLRAAFAGLPVGDPMLDQLA